MMVLSLQNGSLPVFSTPGPEFFINPNTNVIPWATMPQASLPPLNSADVGKKNAIAGRMERICYHLNIQDGSVLCRRNSTRMISTLQKIVKCFQEHFSNLYNAWNTSRTISQFFKKWGKAIKILVNDLRSDSIRDFYKNNHVSTVVSVNAESITLAEATEYAGSTGVVVRSLTFEQFRHYVNNDLKKGEPAKDQSLGILNNKELTPLIANQAKRMADYYIEEARIYDVAKAAFDQAKAALVKAKEGTPDLTATFKVECRSAASPLVEKAQKAFNRAKKELKKAQKTGYAYPRLVSSPMLSSEATDISRQGILASYKEGYLMDANGKKAASICSEMAMSIVLMAQIDHQIQKQALSRQNPDALLEGEKKLQQERADPIQLKALTVEELKELQKVGAVMNLDPERVTPGKFVEELQKAGFEYHLITLDQVDAEVVA